MNRKHPQTLKHIRLQARTCNENLVVTVQAFGETTNTGNYLHLLIKKQHKQFPPRDAFFVDQRNSRGGKFADEIEILFQVAILLKGHCRTAKFTRPLTVSFRGGPAEIDDQVPFLRRPMPRLILGVDKKYLQRSHPPLEEIPLTSPRNGRLRKQAGIRRVINSSAAVSGLQEYSCLPIGPHFPRPQALQPRKSCRDSQTADRFREWYANPPEYRGSSDGD